MGNKEFLQWKNHIVTMGSIHTHTARTRTRTNTFYSRGGTRCPSQL